MPWFTVRALERGDDKTGQSVDVVKQIEDRREHSIENVEIKLLKDPNILEQPWEHSRVHKDKKFAVV